ncbi:MAG: hypothetical protein ACRDTM_07885 [Micromonosporaceae bacterium]
MNQAEPGKSNLRTHIYQVRPSIGGPPVLSVTVDRQSGMLTVAATDGWTIRLDVVMARALWIVIQEAVYERRSLRSDGPTLTLSFDRGTGRMDALKRDA